MIQQIAIATLLAAAALWAAPVNVVLKDAKGVEVGMSLDGTALQDLREEYPPVQEMLKDAPVEALYTVTDIYPAHIVIDGNHPLAGISIDLEIKVHAVREATVDEVGSGSAGVGFFKIS